MSGSKNPLEDAVEQAVEQAVAAFVYAPIGLVLDGPARFGDLVRNGRNQVSNARMMGQFAVQMGRAEAEKRAADADGPIGDLLRGLGLAPTKAKPQPAPAPAPAPEPASAPAAPAPSRASKATKATKAARKTAVRTAGKAKAAAKATAGALPITDYDSLSASQVVSRLRGLAPKDLDAVRAYESATRARKTVLNRISQLQKG